MNAGRGTRDAGRGRRHSARRWLFAGAVALSTLLPPASALAQDPTVKLRAQRDTLDQIRRERQALEERAAQLQSSVHDLNDEVTNLNARADATARIVHTLDAQLASINADVTDATTKVAITQAELTDKQNALRQRLIEIYKRGPLFTTQALLSAHSFGDLVARYKYLHLLALHDRALVNQVTALRDEVATERDRLVTLQNALEENRADKASEEEQLRDLERQRASTLANTRRQARQTQDRLARLRATETQLTNAIAMLETARRRAATRSTTARASSSIRTSDYGKLAWPVDGSLVYTFGKAQTASNTTIRWNGVGIQAPVNTSVHAVAAGRVVRVGQLGTYGLTIIIDHGGGDYSIYGSLAHADVRDGETVAKGQVIGGVGMSDPDLPPHLHFEIRHSVNGGAPQAVDPATWLQGQP